MTEPEEKQIRDRLREVAEKPVPKTFKREVAILMLLIFGVVGFHALSNEPAMLIFDKLRWPVFTFVAGAFGLDQIAKTWGAR